MNKNSFRYFLILVLIAAGNCALFAQEPTPVKRNFSYTHNPTTKIKTPPQTTPVENAQPEAAAPTEPIAAVNTEKTDENLTARSAANKTLEVVKRAAAKNLAPTETYKVGVGDVLFISLQNAPAKDSTYFTVLNDGTIDYPLAGEMVSVSGFTVEEIEDVLREKIKIYENPQVTIKIRDYSSHSITVLGLAEKPGAKYLQREALPLYVVKAEAIVQPQANQAVIRRINGQVETVGLKDSKSDEILILPGDIVEFSNGASVNNSDEPSFFFIGGNIVSAGQKDFHNGMTLTQAILAAGGLSKSNVKKVIVRRKNKEGLLAAGEFDLREIKDGKIPDPEIFAGDTIEVLK